MSLKNRISRLVIALSLVTLVTAQLPMPSSVALAQNDYSDPGEGKLSLEGAGGMVVAGLLIGFGYAALVKSGALAAGSLGEQTAGIGEIRFESASTPAASEKN